MEEGREGNGSLPGWMILAGTGWGVNKTGQGAVVDSILHEGHFSGAHNGLSGCILAIPRDLKKKKNDIYLIEPFSLFFSSIVKYFIITHHNTYVCF